MKLCDTALILIGFQHDYFSSTGILSSAIEQSKINNIVNNTVALINSLKLTELSVVSTPITFSKNYQELDDEPVGILKLIKELGAFQEGELGSQIIPELLAFGNRIDYLSGKHGFNAFNDTKLESYLRTKKIENILLAGAVTSICIDSTARYATEIGFKVTIISDCTSARTLFEQKFYCEQIFPLYADVVDYKTITSRLLASQKLYNWMH